MWLTLGEVNHYDSHESHITRDVIESESFIVTV